LLCLLNFFLSLDFGLGHRKWASAESGGCRTVASRGHLSTRRPGNRFTFPTGLTAALACPAFSADAAGTGTDHFIAAANRAHDVHEHVPKCFLDPFGVAMTVARELRRAVIWDVVCDHVDQFFLAGPRQIGDRTIERLFLHFWN